MTYVDENYSIYLPYVDRLISKAQESDHHRIPDNAIFSAKHIYEEINYRMSTFSSHNKSVVYQKVHGDFILLIPDAVHDFIFSSLHSTNTYDRADKEEHELALTDLMHLQKLYSNYRNESTDTKIALFPIAEVFYKGREAMIGSEEDKRVIKIKDSDDDYCLIDKTDQFKIFFNDIYNALSGGFFDSQKSRLEDLGIINVSILRTPYKLEKNNSKLYINNNIPLCNFYLIFEKYNDKKNI